jgi:diguanylate cyclase (GGDEF)-like protein
MISRKLLLLTLLLTAFFTIAVWSVLKFDKAYILLAKHTQLSAWSLAQLEVETLEFTNQLEKHIYLGSQFDELNLRYDILWNRYRIFLDSDETKLIRSEYNSQEVISKAFQLLKGYEYSITHNDVDQLKLMLEDFKAINPSVRNLMIQNFTGEDSLKQRSQLDNSKQENVYYMVIILVAFFLMSFWVYRDAKQQQFLAWYDPLTKLRSRNYMLSTIKAREKRGSIVLILMDISGFKELNNNQGYEYGDGILTGIAESLSQQCSGNDMVCARMGADEFAVLMDKPREPIDEFLRIFWFKLNNHLKQLDSSHHISLDIGVATSDDQHSNPRSCLHSEKLILNRADSALNIAKLNKKEHIIFFDNQIEAAQQKRRQLSIELSQLIDDPTQQQIYLNYQPIIHATNRKLGCEALIRWNHPVHGFVNPEYLIALAEDSGHAKALGKWIMQQVYQLIEQDLSHYIDQLEISINLSDALFDYDLADMVEEIFHTHTNFLPAVILEITETMTLDDLKRSMAILKSLERINVRVALDDFGTGWSSLYNLNHLKFNKLKIDRSFVTDIHTLEKQRYFINSIVNLSHQLGLTVVAEGIERIEEFDALNMMNINEFQGYYFARPLLKNDFITYCNQHFSKVTLNNLTT